MPPADPLPGAHPRDRDLENGTFEPYFDTMVGADFQRAGDLPVAVLAGRLPQAGSTYRRRGQQSRISAASDFRRPARRT